ncbi:Fic family protein [Streptomyces albogriseolus]|uniref:Fic family protein n=1 Tax=Streptomyces albogriseolus TaxID=1887 RepID=UPI003810F220
MTSGPGHHGDALADWLRIRPQISWPCWSGARPSAGAPAYDGFRDFFTTTRGSRDAEGTKQILTALDLALADAAQGRRLSFDLLENWQRTVLHQPSAPFRTEPAFAKDGRERYGLSPSTPALFESCLSESTQPDLSLPSRAARTYLDVLFFHPFEDGNARAAMLALAFVLAREGAPLDQVHPLQATRWADDADGAADLAVLLGILVTAAERRLSNGRPPPSSPWSVNAENAHCRARILPHKIVECRTRSSHPSETIRVTNSSASSDSASATRS